jgi:hypothetical protein
MREVRGEDIVSERTVSAGDDGERDRDRERFVPEYF